MTEQDKQFRRIHKRLTKAKKHAAKGKAGAEARKTQYEQDLLAHVFKYGKPQGF